MAQKKTTRKKRVNTVKFELTKSSIGGIAVVCFCLFLWMFLIGVWTGQSLLSPYPQVKELAGNHGVKKDPPFIKAVEKKRIIIKRDGTK